MADTTLIIKISNYKNNKQNLSKLVNKYAIFLFINEFFKNLKKFEKPTKNLANNTARFSSI